MQALAFAAMTAAQQVVHLLLPAAYVLLLLSLTVGSYALWHVQTYGRL